MWGGVGGVAVAAGPVLGGILVSTLNWRAVFFLNVPLGLLGWVFAQRCIPRVPGTPRPLNIPTQLTAVLALGALTYAFIECGTRGWTDTRVLTAGGTAVPKLPMTIGLAAGAAGLGCLALVGAHTPYALVLGPMLAIGFGMPFTAPAATAAGMMSAPAAQGGVISGLINAARQTGSVMGVAVMGAFIGHHDGFIFGMHGVFALAALFFLMALAMTTAWLRPGTSAAGHRPAPPAPPRAPGPAAAPVEDAARSCAGRCRSASR